MSVSGSFYFLPSLPPKKIPSILGQCTGGLGPVPRGSRVQPPAVKRLLAERANRVLSEKHGAHSKSALEVIFGVLFTK